MKSNRFLLVILSVVSVMFTQCKSVDITVLGLYDMKITNPKSKPVLNEKLNMSASAEECEVIVTGVITDDHTQPMADVEIFLMKDTKVEYHAVTASNGSYSIKVSPDTYNFYLVQPAKNQNKVFNNVALEETKEKNFIF